MPGPYLSIIIPAYNEKRRILPTLQKVLSYLSGQTYTWELIVADDGSTDSTPAIVEDVARTENRLKLLRLTHKGKGWAVQQGMLQAKGEYRFFADADLSMPIEFLDAFLPNSNPDFDIAIASRQIKGARRFNEPRLRYLMSRVFNLATRSLIAPGLSDTQCGFKCFRAHAAEELFPLQQLTGFSFDIEILFLAQKKGLKIRQVPIDWYYQGESKVQRLRDANLMLKDILLIRWNYLTKRYRNTDNVNLANTNTPDEPKQM